MLTPLIYFGRNTTKVDFYDLIDTYAELHDMDKEEVLHLWYRGAISAADLLEADLENEGIFGYREHLVDVIKCLGKRAQKDHGMNPWTA